MFNVVINGKTNDVRFYYEKPAPKEDGNATLYRNIHCEITERSGDRYSKSDKIVASSNYLSKEYGFNKNKARVAVLTKALKKSGFDRGARYLVWLTYYGMVKEGYTIFDNIAQDIDK